MFKMLALDMDGTLLGSDKKVSLQNRLAIKKLVSCGIKVVLCSGRGRHSMEEYIEELDLTQNRHIANMGSLIISPSGEAETVSFFSSETLSRIIRPLEELGLSPMVTCKDEILYKTITCELVDDYAWSNKGVAIRKGDIINAANAFKVTIFSYDPSLVEAAGKIVFEDVATYVSDDYFVDYIPGGTDKFSALMVIARENGVLPQEIIAMGDASLDREMIEGCGFGIAVANSDETLKKYADRICDYTNDEDAVARAVYKYIFKRPYME